jgi:hypothetical protein
MEPMNGPDDLERTAPTLHSLPKADPFVVPDGFFERFPHQVQAAIVERAQEQRPAWNRWKRMAIALPIIALLGLGGWWLQRPSSVEPPVAFSRDDLPGDPAVMDDVDEAELLAFIEESHNASADLGAVELRLDENELLAYLETENADLADLMNDIE